MTKILKKVYEDANVLVVTDDSIPTSEPTSWQSSQIENVFLYDETTTDIYVSDKLRVYTLDDSLWTPVSRRFNIQAAPKEYWFIIVNNSSVSLEVYTWVNIQAMLAWWKMAYVSVFNNWSQINISIYWSAWNTNDLWFFVNESSLTTSHTTANNWNYAIVWTTDSIWIWDWDSNTWKDSKVTPTVNEAPMDWKLYVRKNWAWVESEVWWSWWVWNNQKSFELSKPLTAWELVQVLNDWKISCVIENIQEELWTPTVFKSAPSSYISAIQIDTNKVFIAYSDSWNSYYWTWIVATISWTTITYWTPTVFESAGTYFISATQIDTNKVFIGYRDGWNSNYWTWIVATISWTTITYWTPTVFESADTTYISATQIDTNKVFIGYTDGWNSSYWTWIVATISWTTITYWTNTVFESASSQYASAIQIDTNKVFIAYKDVWNSGYWTWIALQFGYKIGEENRAAWILQESWTTWEIKKVALLWWVSSAHTWLTPIWTKVYIQADWTIWTTETAYLLWRIVSATEINMGQNNI